MRRRLRIPLNHFRCLRACFVCAQVVLWSSIIGCGAPDDEPKPIVRSEADDGAMEIILDGETLSFGGMQFKIVAENISNLIVAKTTKNSDDSYTADVLFEIKNESGRFVVESTVQYKIRKAKALGGQVALYPLIGIKTKSVERLDAAGS